MGVSRTTIRETLRRLEAEHLVVNSPNVGPSVAIIDWKAAEQIYEVRALLEGEAAALCAQRVSPDVLAEIRRALEGFEDAVEQSDSEGRIQTTEAFYDAILKGCGNDILADAVRRLNARVSLLRATSMSRSGRSTESAVELRRMYSEIAKGDAEGARSAAKDHVRSAASAARQVFADQSTNPA
jgi:DNA-binding GntR family transcriptional regulator